MYEVRLAIHLKLKTCCVSFSENDKKLYMAVKQNIKDFFKDYMSL